jgi:hypothetical protein
MHIYQDFYRSLYIFIFELELWTPTLKIYKRVFFGDFLIVCEMKLAFKTSKY